jgi:amino acid transporter
MRFLKMMTMVVLMIFSVISWSHVGSGALLANWELRPRGTQNILRDIFNGICIGFLGVSGFETTPTFIEMISIDHYPSVINTLIYSVTLLNAPLMLLVYALLPSSEILSGANVLSLLAEKVGGGWLRTWLVVDAMLILCGGVATGVYTACGLLKTLAEDGVLPNVFLRRLPLTGELAVIPLFFLVACIALYGTATFNLATLSAVYSMAVLVVLLSVSAYPFPRTKC